MNESDELVPRRGSRWQLATGAVVVLLAVATVAGFLLVHHPGSAGTDQPAASGHPLTMTAHLDFHCALPVDTSPMRALVSMPDGGVTVDRSLRSARVVVNSPGSSYVGGRWLPVPIAWVSADGSSYAYITSTTSMTGVPSAAPTSAPSAATISTPDFAVSSTLFVHDVGTDADRQLWSGSVSAWMIGWGPGGVYFMREVTSGGLFNELWAVDPSGHGGAHRVGPSSAPPAAGTSGGGLALSQAGTLIAGGAAWTTGYLVNLNEQAPFIDAVTGKAQYGVIRMDLSDGSVTTWFTAPAGMGVRVVAVDQKGHPVLILNSIQKPVRQPGTSSLVMPWPPPPRVLLLTGPNQTVEIATGSDPSFTPFEASADAHGVWFATPGSLWLYRQGTLVKVADVHAGPFALPPPPSVAPTPPSVAPAPPIVQATRPPGLPTGVTLTLAGPCR